MKAPRVVRALNIMAIMLAGFLLAVPNAAFSQKVLDEATALNQQIKQLYDQQRYSEAIPLARRALAIREKALGPRHPDVAESLNYLGDIYNAQGHRGGPGCTSGRSPYNKKRLAPIIQRYVPNDLGGLYKDAGRSRGTCADEPYAMAWGLVHFIV